MNVAALIRCVFLDNDAMRLRRELEPFFGDSVFFVMDRYCEADRPGLVRDGANIEVGRAFLEKHDLPYFPEVGWLCGDFAYYAAAEALPQFDHYWLIENDVSFRIDAQFWFSETCKSQTDFLAWGGAPAPPTWHWFESMNAYVQGRVYSCFFPVSRMSNRAAAHLLRARAEYSRQRASDMPYANDEAFVASILVRDGFTLGNINQWSDRRIFRHFSFHWPTHPGELAHIEDAIVHPVCEGQQARLKFSALAARLEENRSALQRRYREFRSRLPDEKWEEFSGLDPSILFQSEPHLTGGTPQSTCLAQICDQLGTLFASSGSDLKSAWIYEKRIVVLDCLIDGASFAFDSVPVYEEADGDKIISKFLVEALPRNAGGRALLSAALDRAPFGERILLGAISAEDNVASLAQAIAALIRAALHSINAIAGAHLNPAQNA